MDSFINKLEEIIDVSATAPRPADKEVLDAFFKKYKLDKHTFSHFKSFLRIYGSCYIKDDYYFMPLPNLPLISDQQKYEIDKFLGLGHDKDNIEKYLADYHDIVEDDLLPIAEIVGGDLICIHRNTGEIWFWFHESTQDNLLKAANTFAEFILNFKYFDPPQVKSAVRMNLDPKLDAFLKAAAKKENAHSSAVE